MDDPVFKAHKEFMKETFHRNMNRAIAGPFWFSDSEGDVTITSCYSYREPIHISRKDLKKEKENSVLDAKKIVIDDKEFVIVFWKDGWFGYTTTLHQIKPAENPSPTCDEALSKKVESLEKRVDAMRSMKRNSEIFSSGRSPSRKSSPKRRSSSRKSRSPSRKKSASPKHKPTSPRRIKKAHQKKSL